MREEINFQLKLTKKFTEILNSQQLLKIKEIAFEEIWFTGSGDSHCASLFAASLFNQLDIPTRAFTPMDLSYFHQSKVINPCLVAISVSGKTPRVIEVVLKFKKKYPLSEIIGLTDNPNSPLFKEATIPILIGASPSELLSNTEYQDEIAKQYTGYHHDVAQTKTYYANLLWIIGFAIIRKELLNNIYDELMKNLEDLEIWNEKCEKWVINNTLTHPKKTIFVGSGLFSSLAQFGQYKWFEFTFPGLKQDIEEYAHTSYFATNENSSIIFLAPLNPHYNRVMELIEGALKHLIKPEMFIVTSSNQNNHDDKNPRILITPQISKNMPIIWQEVVIYLYSLIYIEWLSYHTARLNGLDTNKFRGGAEGEKYVKGSFHTIRKSKINANETT